MHKKWTFVLSMLINTANTKGSIVQNFWFTCCCPTQYLGMRIKKPNFSMALLTNQYQNKR